MITSHGKMNNRIIILILCDYFLPGYKGGGAVRTVANTVDQLGDEIRFRIITRDRDYLDKKPYKNIRADRWNRIDKADVYYLAPKQQTPFYLLKIIKKTPHDILFLNSFFSVPFSTVPLLLNRFGLIKNRSILLAPRGEFSPGALQIKKTKKLVYMAIMRLFGFCRGISWQASTIYEKKEIYRWFGKNMFVVVAQDLVETHHPSGKSKKIFKKPGELKIIFLSRISRKKNLIGALNMLKKISGKIKFDIYGPREDREYWNECEKEIKTLPGDIKVCYMGSVEHDQVPSVLSSHHLFFFPTFGENFGHVILEAMQSGLPVLTSNLTPWQELEKQGLGWDLPIERDDLFNKALQHCVEMGNLEFQKLSANIINYAATFIKDDAVLGANRKMFKTVVNFNKER